MKKRAAEAAREHQKKKLHVMDPLVTTAIK